MQPDHALLEKARRLDADDPLAAYRDRFLPLPEDVVAYLDGNSLGRPLRTVPGRLEEFVRAQWAGRLIRGWDEGWMGLAEDLGDRIGAVALGAGPGQVVVADSTTVLLYKLARAAVEARPGRREIVLDTENFPTDRYLLEGIAEERDLRLVWVEADLAGGVTPGQVAAAVGPDTALVLLSHVAYRSGFLADGPAITRLAHDAGALVLWDLSHSVGSVELALDAWGADLAAGCTYKYLNAGPGAPAFGYVRRDLQDRLRQPIWGWLGRRDPFAMEQGYQPADGVRSLVSGTPPVLGMVPLSASVDLLEEVGMSAVRAKSEKLTAFALELVDAWLAPLGVDLLSPRDPDCRGSHLTLRREGFREVADRLRDRGVIPDYREPDGIRVGLSPLSTSFEETRRGLAQLRDLVSGTLGRPG